MNHPLNVVDDLPYNNFGPFHEVLIDRMLLCCHTLICGPEITKKLSRNKDRTLITIQENSKEDILTHILKFCVLRVVTIYTVRIIQLIHYPKIHQD